MGVRQVPLGVPLGPNPTWQPLSPADGLFDWPLLQMDKVVQSGGALVIIHLCNKCPIQGGVVPSSQPRAPAPLPLPNWVPYAPPVPLLPNTNRPGQVAAYRFLLHQL